MNRSEAKDLLPIIQGYVDGKKIEKRPKGRYDVEWQETDLPAFNAHTCDYRIKPEPKYRPFKDAEECWQEMLKHQPLGWVKSALMVYSAINNIGERGIIIHNGVGDTWYDFKRAFEMLTFADGTSFGIKD